LGTGIQSVDADIRNILEGLEQEANPSRDDIIALLRTPDERLLFTSADKTRERYIGNEVHLRGIIEFSNYCVKNCLYCGLRRDNRRLQRYRMTPDEILATAEEAAGEGLKTIVLQSGEDPFFTGDALSRLTARLKERHDVAVTMSVGERTKGDYRLMREAGADRYLLKHETSDPKLFSKLRPGTSLEGRLKRLHWLKELGFQVGSGNMVGLPGQEVGILADDIMLMRDLDVEMAGIGPFVPHYDTPLSYADGGDVAATLRVLAVTRLVLPYTHLPATTALGSIHPEGREMALACGANVIMPNMTPLRYRKLYEIYPNRTGVNQVSAEMVPRLVALIHRLGRKVSVDHGHSPKPGFGKRLDPQRKEVSHEA
jgi:biotin synthase